MHTPSQPQCVSALTSSRARVRAALIACILIVEGIQAVPSKPLNESHLTGPTGARWVRRIEQALAVVGSHPTRDQITARVIAISEGALSVRRALLEPTKALAEITRTGQQWPLFASGRRECYRLLIEARGADMPFRTVYQANGVDTDNLAPLLEYRRIRGSYDANVRHGPSGSYGALVHLVAQRLFAVHPELTVVRARLERLYVGSPGQAVATLGFEHEVSEAR